MSDNEIDQIKAGATPAHWGRNFTKTFHSNVYPAIDPTRVKFDDGYTVCITGASFGLGAYIAKAFALAGARNVIILARSADKLEQVRADMIDIASHNSKQISVSICVGDATKTETYDEIHDLIVKHHGSRLDCLVCNAGGGGQKGELSDKLWADKIEKTEAKDFFGVTQLNYLSSYYAARRLIPLLLHPQSIGRTLINISSLSAHMLGPGALAYNISKFALNRLTEIIDDNHKEDGLVAVALHPGAVVTPGVEAIASHLKDILKDDIQLCGAVCVWIARTRPEYLSGRFASANWDVDELNSMKDDIVKHDKLKFRMVV